MSLIQRYSQYADLSLPTAATIATSTNTRRHQPNPKHAWLSKRYSQLSAEKDAWKDALSPSLEELQAVSRRMLSDPELSQSNLFKFCAPLFVFASLLAVGVLVPRHPEIQAAAASALGDVSNHKAELVLAVLAILSVVLGGLLVLRIIISGVAMGVCSFAAMDIRRKKSDPGSFELSQSNLILGGLFVPNT